MRISWSPSKSGALLFFTPGLANYPELETELEAWGAQRDMNLAVGHLRRDDAAYHSVMGAFSVERSPAIVIAGVESSDVVDKGIHVRMPFVVLDDKEMLANTERTMEALESIYDLFVEREFVEAVGKVGEEENRLDHDVTLSGMGGFATMVCDLLDEHKIEHRPGDGDDQGEQEGWNIRKKGTLASLALFEGRVPSLFHNMPCF
ncbi:MAG: hypothetical protein A4E32_01197 [Methanomassiliicoccales archaeon PtaU1.Bin124]|nr:MAG: hypothetical protein A4E32_01197 [Methanomassiliicoccales archaeon PtaU1.Bin124]